MGSPSLYFVFSVPQDGIRAPADFNASVSGYLRGIWNGTATGTGAGTLAGPDSNGYYTATLTGVTIPDSAVMLTGGIGYSYNVTSTLPLTQTNITNNPYPYHNYPVWAAGKDPGTPCVETLRPSPRCNGGLISIAPNVQKVATGYTGRRTIVEDARCNKCHQELGTFTEDAFHAGQRNDGTTCAWCHTPNKTSSGWSADSIYFVHAIHAGAKRDQDFTWHASAVGSSFKEVAYPGVLNFCEGCHIPGGYDFSLLSDTTLASRLYRTVATGAFNGNTAGQTIQVPGAAPGCALGASGPATDVATYGLSPYIASAAPGTASPNYGADPTSYFNAAAADSVRCSPEGGAGAAFTVKAGGTMQSDTSANDTSNGPGGITMGRNAVNSPIVGVCSACHDSTAAIAHFEINGGSFYKVRGPGPNTALDTVETCIVCHGPGRIADIKEVHSH